MKKVSIIGMGRFGKTLLRLIEADFNILLYDKNHSVFSNLSIKPNIKVGKDLKDVFVSDVIFYAVPINEFEKVIKSHKKYFRDSHLLIDVLSVKVHPKKVLERHLQGIKTEALLTHPMFGPDSSRNGFDDLPIILDKFTSSSVNYEFWKKYFTAKGLKVVEMSAEKHDKIAADTQGLTHFIGRLLDEVKFSGSTIDSLGTKKLVEVKDQTVNDTWQLFTDLQQFNPYTKSMRLKLGEAYDSLYNKLLPKQVSENTVTLGIQGGRGSFNEEAVMYYINRYGIENYKIEYLYTSEAVLKALHEGKIDRGQFAIHNSVGGTVMESIEAMANYKFRIKEQFAIKIAHALMTHLDIDFKEINTVMSHPQVFAQCKRTLAQKYSRLKQVSGKGKLIDHALVAKHLVSGNFPKNIAVMGSKVLAKIYGLKVIEENLQDAKENYTSFLIVERS